jgi:DNA topoisomerase-3
VIPRDLTSDAGLLWLAVVRRFMVAFSDPAVVSTLTRRLTLGVDVAVVSGKSYDQLGWIELDNDLARLTGHDAKLPPGFLPRCGDKVPLIDAKLHEGKTTPPKAFTEATLLSLMENIHTSFEESEEDLKEALGAKGIGTPATRASIIELLISREYIQRFKKGATTYLRATENGRSLISNLKSLKLEMLTQAKLTAEWETKLMDMESSKGSDGGQRRIEFLTGICSIVDECLSVLKTNQSPQSQGAGYGNRGGLGNIDPKEIDILCPFTGKPATDHGNYWSIAQYPSVRLYKTVASRQMVITEYFDILRNSSPTFQGFVSSKGKAFNAKLSFDQSSGRFNFEFDKSVPFAGEETKHTCPNTGKAIVDNGKFWLFPSLETRFWKEVSGRKMKISDYVELVKTGSTGYFENFKSKAGKPFTAALVLENKLVKFQFPNSGGDRGDKSSRSGAGVSSSHPSNSASLVKNMGMKGPGARAKKS